MQQNSGMYCLLPVTFPLLAISIVSKLYKIEKKDLTKNWFSEKRSKLRKFYTFRLRKIYTLVFNF